MVVAAVAAVVEVEVAPSVVAPPLEIPAKIPLAVMARCHQKSGDGPTRLHQKSCDSMQNGIRNPDLVHRA